MNNKILIVDDEEAIRELFEIIIESEFDHEIIHASSGNEAVKILERDKDISIILTDYTMPDGKGSVVYDYNKNHENYPLFLVTGGYLDDYDDMEGFNESNPLNKLIPKPLDEDLLIESIKNVIKSYSSASKENTQLTEKNPDRGDYKKININYILKVVSNPIDIFIKLKSGKFLKAVDKENEFDLSLIEELKSKGQKHAYLDESIFGEVKENLIRNIEKRFDNAVTINDSYKATGDALEMLTNASCLEIPKDQERIVKASANSCIKNLKSNPKIAPLLDHFFKEQGYVVSHAITSMHLSYMICKKMSFLSEMTIEKITYAAIIHDLSFKNTKLSEVIDLSGENYEKLSSSDKNEIKNHPFDAADIIGSFNGMHGEIERILKEHHEKPDGSGFPRGLTANNISPLGAIFILAVRSADFLYHNGKNSVKLTTFMANLKGNYNKGPFKKPLTGLIEILENV